MSRCSPCSEVEWCAPSATCHSACRESLPLRARAPPSRLSTQATEPPETEHKPEDEADPGSHGNFEPPATAGSETHGTIGPVSQRGATPPAGRSLFLTPRPMPPEYARQQTTTYGAGPNNRGNASNLGSSPQLPARTDALAQAGGQQPGQGPVLPSDTKETPKQPSPAVPVPSPANPAPKQPSQSGTDPLTKLKEHVTKTGKPISIRDYYDEKTPLEEKILLKHLILSLKAPPGEKLPLPIANLQHWLNVENRPTAENEGPLEIPFSDLSKFGVMKTGGHKILEYFGEHPDEKTLEKKSTFDWLRSRPGMANEVVSIPDIHWDTQVSGRAPWPAGYFGYARPGNEEFFYGLGDATLTGQSSGTRGFVDKGSSAKVRGNITYSLKDRYDWNKNQGVTIPFTTEMIQKYQPKDVPLTLPEGKTIQVNDSFFHDLEKRGHGRSFDVRSKSLPMMYEFHQPKPGQKPVYRLIPTPPPAQPPPPPLKIEGPGVHL
jgi:hypothetical protein